MRTFFVHARKLKHTDAHIYDFAEDASNNFICKHILDAKSILQCALNSVMPWCPTNRLNIIIQHFVVRYYGKQLEIPL